MSYRVIFGEDGPYVIAETAEETARLLNILPRSKRRSSVSLPASNVVPMQTPQVAIGTFFLAINDNARKLMLTLLRHEKGVRADQFAEETGIGVEKMGGILGGASKLAKKNNLSFEDFVLSEMKPIKSERVRIFRPGKLLIESASKLKQTVKGETSVVEPGA